MRKTPATPSLPRRPKYVQLADRLRTQMNKGVLKPGDQLPTFAQMQTEFGLGQATLERTYAILEDEKLIIRHPGRGTFVAPPRATPQHYTVGILIQLFRVEHPYNIHLLQGMREAAERAGVEIMLLHENSAVSWEKIDGALIVDLDETMLTLPQSMPRAGIFGASDSMPRASVDDYEAARDLVRHLVSLGHRRIAFLLMNYRKTGLTGERLRGYMDALKEAELTLPASCKRTLREPGESMQRYNDLGYNKMREWFREGWGELGCTAIVTQNDETALGVMKAVVDEGLSVPDDLSVTGFDGTEIADYYRPRLTTVTVPLEDIGAAAMDLLLEQIRNPNHKATHREVKPVKLPARLRIADSTAPPRAA
jgi:GntR family transcriptional regulator, arabinose operon transcriptional repressor